MRGGLEALPRECLIVELVLAMERLMTGIRFYPGGLDDCLDLLAGEGPETK